MSKFEPPQDRKTRLAEALRANLKRRKGQARARAQVADEVSQPERSAPGNEESAALLPQSNPRGTPGR